MRIIPEFDEKMSVRTLSVLPASGTAVPLLSGTGFEFLASTGEYAPDSYEIVSEGHNFKAVLKCGSDPAWEATETIALIDNGHLLIRDFEYTVKQDFEGYFATALLLHLSPQLRYTYPLQHYEKSAAEIGPTRRNSSWAVPLPVHIWTDGRVTAVYGCDRSRGSGTPDFAPGDGQSARLGFYFPDGTGMDSTVKTPVSAQFKKDDVIKISEYIACEEAGAVPLLQAEKLAARVMLEPQEAVRRSTFEKTAEKIFGFYKNNGLWNPDALGPGRGWYRNMWVYTTAPQARVDPYYDLGWGEGYGVYAMEAILSYWKRTGDASELDKVEEMTRNLDLFKRKPCPGEPFYDRFIPQGIAPLHAKDTWGTTDFMGYKRVWTHCLANIGLALLDMFENFPGYPSQETRMKWLSAALEISGFLLERRKPDGDINDGFNEDDSESNIKKHRIPARAAVCGLWTRCDRYLPASDCVAAAQKLAHRIAGEIDIYEFYNQMIDIHADARWVNLEVIDGENAAYALLGLTELLGATGDPVVRRLCEESAAYLYTWVYFYDVKYAYGGRSRGGTTCRMPDFPLLYIGAGNIAMRALVKLAALTGDGFHRFMAAEILNILPKYLWDAPGKPWDGGVVHAVDQSTGEHWGPERKGQVDSGMTSGTSLICVEFYLSGGFDNADK